jgi:hypothetical protein
MKDSRILACDPCADCLSLVGQLLSHYVITESPIMKPFLTDWLPGLIGAIVGGVIGVFAFEWG